jgi:predicted amidohydrolase YtcJ
MYTSRPAEQDGAAAWKGTLEPGKVADLCILSADPYLVGVAGLEALRVERTLVGGRTVFDASTTHIPA